MLLQSDDTIGRNSALADAPKPKATHLGYLDSLRALAALYVCINHARLQIWPDGATPGLANIVASPFMYGHYAVGLFIVLSGFCLMLPIARGDGSLRGGAMQFFRRRARRILPPYYASLAFSLLLIATIIGRPTGTHWDMCLPVTWRDIWTHVLMLQDMLSPSKINHVLWSISVEWRIYFLFPLLVLGWRRAGPLPIVGLTCAAVLAFSVLARGTILMGVTPQYLILFVLGMLGASCAFAREGVFQTLRERLPWGLIALLLAGLAMSLSHWLIGRETGWQVFLLDVMIGCASTSLLVAASRSQAGTLRRALEWPPLVWVGTFAYSLYLIHAPLLQVICQYALFPLHLGAVWAFALLTLVGLPIITGAAYLFFLAFERPFLSRRPQESPAELARDAVLSPAP